MFCEQAKPTLNGETIFQHFKVWKLNKELTNIVYINVEIEEL